MHRITLGKLRSLIAESLFLTEGPVGVDGAKQVMAKFPKGMAKLGIKPEMIKGLKPLGTGTRGTAFQLPDGNVLKITNDQSEAEAASMIVGTEAKNLVKIHNVWQFGDTGFFGVLQEKLESLPDDEAKKFNNALIATGLPIWIAKSGGEWSNAKELTKEHVKGQIKKKFGGNFTSDEAKAYVQDVNQKWNMLVSEYGLRDLFNTLTKLGINFHDYHAGNIMRRSDGTLVLIDLGMSKIKGSPKVGMMNQAVNNA
jgi:hypothetical protein